MGHPYVIGALVIIVIATFLLLAAVFGKGGIIKGGVISIDVKSGDTKLSKTSRIVLGGASVAGYLLGVILIFAANVGNGNGPDQADELVAPASPTPSPVDVTVIDELQPDVAVSEDVDLQIEGLPNLRFKIDKAQPSYSLPVTFGEAGPYIYDLTVNYVDRDGNTIECVGSGTINVSHNAKFYVNWQQPAGGGCVAQLIAQ
jgi:hypothetical protein